MAAVLDDACLMDEAAAAALFADAAEEADSALIDAHNGAASTGHLCGKAALVDPSTEDFEELLDRLQMRVHNGRGECLYELGVATDSDDCGLSEEQLAAAERTLQALAERVGGAATALRRRAADSDAPGGCTADYLVRREAERQDFAEVRVSVVGNVDAGKSTLLGVLTHGELDNGRGHARLKLFRHKHEVESGRTSSVGNDILGFDVRGAVVNDPDPHDGRLDWVHICEAASKVITFIDLAGHEKYLKTTIFGMTGHLPDYSMLMVGANAGVVGMTKEHLGLALALNVPVFVVVTKVDSLCPEGVLKETIKLLCKLLKSPGCRKLPVMVQTLDDVVVCATNFTSERICPIFQVSNVTGLNLDLLRTFLNLLPVRSYANATEPAEFHIDDTYWVDGVGAVVSGTCIQGTIRLNDTLLLGPNELGEFKPVPIKSIHRKRMPVRQLHGGQTASFALRKHKKKEIRKGMVLVSPLLHPQSCLEFEAEVLVLHHPTTISTKYQAMVHCGPVRQTATILHMSKECLRTGDKAQVRFRFIKSPEFLRTGTRLVFREGRTKAVGTVNALTPYESATAHQARVRHSRLNKATCDGAPPPNRPPKRRKSSRQRAESDAALSTPSAAVAEAADAPQPLADPPSPTQRLQQ